MQLFLSIALLVGSVAAEADPQFLFYHTNVQADCQVVYETIVQPQCTPKFEIVCQDGVVQQDKITQKKVKKINPDLHEHVLII